MLIADLMRVLSVSHLDFLSFLLVRYGSGSRHMLLKQFALLLQLPVLLFLVLLKLGQLLRFHLLKLQTLLPAKTTTKQI